MGITSDELAFKIKSKYPVYSDMDNAELVKRVLAKYPVYAKQLDQGDVGKGMIQRGVEKAGDIGSAALESVAHAGRTVAGGIKKVTGNAAERAGRTENPVLIGATAGIGAGLETAADLMLPQDKFSAALAPLGFIGKGAKAARAFGPAKVLNASDDVARGVAAETAREAGARAQGLSKEALTALKARKAARQAARVGAGDPGSVFQAEQRATKAVGAAKNARTEAGMATDAQKALAPQIEGGVKVVRPGKVAKAGGAMVSAATAVPQRYSAAVLADASILGAETPSMAQVAGEYTEAFKKAGIRINEPGWLKRITGSRYPPTETEAAKLKAIVDQASEKLANNTLQESEAFLARKSAAALKRLDKAGWSSQAARDIASFDEVLENSTLPNIRDLSRRYFRAAAKEQFEHLLPRNKNMSPNALRALIMGNEVVNAGKALVAKEGGGVGAAAGHLLKAGAMSPLVAASGIKLASKGAKAVASKGARKAALPAYNAARILLSPDGQQVKAEDDQQAAAMKRMGYKTLGAPR